MRSLFFILMLAMTSCNADDDAKRALDDARRFAAEGDYDAALAKHVWFHDHALSITPSYYGVRLSFALSDWIELGAKYPKAIETLKAIRDTKTSKLVAGQGNRELFHDVESINEHLGESAATVRLFKRIEASESALAATLYDLADEALLEAHEFALAKKYLGNPTERLTAAQRKFEEGMRYAKAAKNGDASRRAFESIFASEIVRLITVLNETGDKEGAKVVQTEALKTLDNDSIKNALPR